MASLKEDLKPELVRPYLKLLTEAVVTLNNNKGSLRKDIWSYLYRKYGDAVDYRDFLLAIRRFKIDGKLINNEGIYNMHSEVLEEVKEKIPTPVFHGKGIKDGKENTSFSKFMKGGSHGANGGSKGSKYASGRKFGSKISNAGKRQKIKYRTNAVVDPSQKIIENYLKKQKFDDEEDDKERQQKTTSKLGFQTPVPNGAAKSDAP